MKETRVVFRGYAKVTKIVKYIALGLIRLYQHTLSVILPSSCRFIPSCSQYGYEAIQRFGFFRGGWLTVKRIGRCHPLYHGDLYDPVPEVLHVRADRGRQE